MTNLQEKVDTILSQFTWEEYSVKKAKVIKKQLIELKKVSVNEWREIRNAVKSLIVPKIIETKAWLKLNTKKRPRKEKVEVVKEVEAPEVEPTDETPVDETPTE